MDQYAVFGNPIAQSKSPLIHQAFATQTGQELEYRTILAPVEGFEASLQDFFADSAAKGCNVTVPFKERAAKWVDSLSPAAKVSGAVNTIIRQEDGSFLGDNTDGYGLVLDLNTQGVECLGKRVLLIGAGGAAKGVLAPLLEMQPREIIVCNRTAEKAVALASLDSSNKTRGCGFDDLASALINENVDVVINSTSASLSGNLPAIDDQILAAAETVYDMVYAAQPTVFMQHCYHLGVTKIIDGLGMLVGQAAQSFYLWRGVKPDIKPVSATLRAKL